MQTLQGFRHALPAAALLALVACGSSDTPYDRIADPPLVQARLHAVTLISDAATAAERIREAGYTQVRLAPNYERAVGVEASIWNVPEPVAAAVQDFKAPKAGAPDLRLLVMPPGSPAAPAAQTASSRSRKSFFRNVLGMDVPAWPLPGSRSDDLRVQVWTCLIPDVVAATKRMREAGIPVHYGPVGLTTSYLGDHRTVAIRAPDGTVVQLVETQAQ
jgi:hypothetical protein